MQSPLNNEVQMNTTHDSPTQSVDGLSQNQMQTDDQMALTTNSETDELNHFRRNSLLLVSFPWFTSIPMAMTDLAYPLREEREYGYVSRSSNRLYTIIVT